MVQMKDICQIKLLGQQIWDDKMLKDAPKRKIHNIFFFILLPSFQQKEKINITLPLFLNSKHNNLCTVPIYCLFYLLILDKTRELTSV